MREPDEIQAAQPDTVPANDQKELRDAPNDDQQPKPLPVQIHPLLVDDATILAGYGRKINLRNPYFQTKYI